jgi:hypothetical protein
MGKQIKLHMRLKSPLHDDQLSRLMGAADMINCSLHEYDYKDKILSFLCDRHEDVKNMLYFVVVKSSIGVYRATIS